LVEKKKHGLKSLGNGSLFMRIWKIGLWTSTCLAARTKTMSWGSFLRLRLEQQKELAKGTMYLHEECQKRIFHYDIKPENVHLDMNLEPKVADFGFPNLCSRENVSVNTL